MDGQSEPDMPSGAHSLVGPALAWAVSPLPRSSVSVTPMFLPVPSGLSLEMEVKFEKLSPPPTMAPVNTKAYDYP